MKIGPGRNPKRITISEAREVGPEEFAQAQKGSDPVVKRFRESHHMMARLFAMGMPNGQIATTMGMSYSRVGMFAGDPAFRNLVAEYRLLVNSEWLETAAGRLAMMDYLHGMALRQQADQLEDADDGGPPVPIATLLKVSADMADRLGYAKRTVSITVDGTFAAKLDRAIERSGLRRSDDSKLIEHGTMTKGPINNPEAAGPINILQGQVIDSEARAQPPEVEESPGAGESKAAPGDTRVTARPTTSSVWPLEEVRRA